MTVSDSRSGETGWKWEAEVGAVDPDTGGVVNIGDLGVFDTEEEAVTVAVELIGETVAHYRNHRLAGPYPEGLERVPDTAKVSGATVQRFNENGIDYGSQRELP